MFKKTILTIIFIACLFPVFAKADLGPKPSMKFNFIYNNINSIGEPVTIIGGQQIECQDKACNKSEILAEAGPQKFYCVEDYCYSMAYDYQNKYHKLIINFSDKTRESNVFAKVAFDAIYNVTVNENNLVISETTINQNSSFPAEQTNLRFIIALIVTLIVEFLAALIFINIYKLPKKILWAILINIITVPLLWYVAPKFSFEYSIYFYELLIIIFEGLFIYLFFKNIINFKKAIFLSIIINLSSIIFGGFIEMMIFWVIG